MTIPEPSHTVPFRVLVYALDLTMILTALLLYHFIVGFYFPSISTSTESHPMQESNFGFLFDWAHFGYLAFFYAVCAFYKPSLAGSRFASASEVMERCASTLFLSLLAARLFCGVIPLAYLFVVWILAWILITVEQLTIRSFVTSRRRRKGETFHVVLAGDNHEIMSILEKARTDVVLDHVYSPSPLSEIAQITDRTEDLGHLETGIHEGKIHADAVFCATDRLPSSLCLTLARYCREHHIHFYAVPSHTEVLEQKFTSWQMDNALVFMPESSNLERYFQKCLKRTLDILVSLTLLLTVFPWFYAVIAILMKRKSPGPVMIQRQVERLNGKRQSLFFFRTTPYHANLSEELEEESKDTEKDEGETDSPPLSVTQFLSDTHLDRLPMLLNVLWGNASLVGPLPETLNENTYRQALNQRIELRIKPGMISPNPENGGRNSLEQAKYDTLYVRHWTFWRDLCSIFSACGRLFYRIC